MEDIIKLTSGVSDGYKLEYNRTYNNVIFKDGITRNLTNTNEVILIGSSTLSQCCKQLNDKLVKLKLDILTYDDATSDELSNLIVKEIGRKYKQCLLWVGISDIDDNRIIVDADVTRKLSSLFYNVKLIADKVTVIVERKRENISTKSYFNDKLHTFNILLNNYIRMYKFTRLVLPIGFDFSTTVDGKYYKSKDICSRSMRLILETLCIPDLQKSTI